jgi:transposase
VFHERTSVGLDVHARSIVTYAIDGVTGEMSRARLCPEPGEMVAPSRLQRPTGNRVKTNAKDVLHLIRLLRLDEITSIRGSKHRRGAGTRSGAGPR